MPQLIYQGNAAEFTIRYRAICNEGDYKGNWRKSKEEAYKDALRHQNKYPSHSVRIIIEQKQILTLEWNGQG